MAVTEIKGRLVDSLSRIQDIDTIDRRFSGRDGYFDHPKRYARLILR